MGAGGRDIPAVLASLSNRGTDAHEEPGYTFEAPRVPALPLDVNRHAVLTHPRQ